MSHLWGYAPCRGCGSVWYELTASPTGSVIAAVAVGTDGAISASAGDLNCALCGQRYAGAEEAADARARLVLRPARGKVVAAVRQEDILRRETLMKSPSRDLSLPCLECGNVWYELSPAPSRDGSVMKAAVMLGSNGAILSYAGELVCTMCGRRYVSHEDLVSEPTARPLLRVVAGGG